MLRSNFGIALRSLLAARTRTVLTTVGITIGVASILLVFAAGNGARAKASENIGAVPSGTIVLSSGTGVPQPDLAFDTGLSRSAGVFTERDLRTLSDAKFVAASAPVPELAGPVRHASTTDSSAFIAGTTHDIFRLLGLHYVDGGAFSDDDTENIVLGNTVAEKLFGTELASGKTLNVRGDTYTVAGVLAASALPSQVAGVPVNDTVFLPYARAKAYTAGFAQFSRVFADAKPDDYTAIRAALTRNHDDQTDFALDQVAAIQVTSPLLGILVSVTAVTAGLSLVIGGIGIMNIMLVNVSERTREIGIRKSIGASNGTILVQFLIEAGVMSFAGGVLGTIVGLLAGVVGGLFLPFGLLFTPAAIVSVLGVSIAIGVLFGLFPAIRAARKDTIEALRYYQ